MDAIDVRDLPEPVARAIADTVQAWREQLHKEACSRPADLPVWSLGAIGRFTGEEIYDYLDGEVLTP